jgi:hypothetical protein
LKAFEVKTALENLLDENAQGRYNVIGVRNRKNDAYDILKCPQVTVYYKSGQFPKNSSGVNGPYNHDIMFQIDILVGAVSETDISVLQNPDSTPEQIAIALSNSSNAQADADQKTDDLLGLIFDIIMQPQHRTLGTSENADRWIENIQKYPPQEIGEIVIIAATMSLSANATEFTTEEIGVPGNAIHHHIGLTADVSGEAPDGQGVEVFAPKP